MTRWHTQAGYGPEFSGLPPINPAKSKVMSGFCLAGSHEGQPKKTPGGQRLKECLFPQWCICDCHAQEQKLRDMMKLPPPNFRTPGAPIPPRLGVITDISGAFMDVTTPVAEDLTVSVVESSLRSRLEWKVYQICLVLEPFGAHESDIMTVSFFQTRPELEGVSAGAIDAVLNRWADNGFGNMEKKPTRFKGFSVAGKQLGLEEYLRRQKSRRARSNVT